MEDLPQNLEDRLTALEKQFAALEKIVISENKLNKQKLRAVSAALGLNKQADRHVHQSLESFRTMLEGFRQAEGDRQRLVEKLNELQNQKTEEIKSEQKQQKRKVGLQALVLIFLAIAYASGQFQAGDVVNAIVALAPLGLWGVAQAASS